ncbi:hypothetical protein LSAT2_016453 [Lamellibrachia satsuma]|nr:hypothetical protein LSAT2_016453 [Lamellibrachia satsuma]
MDNINTKRSLVEDYEDDCGSFNLLTGFAVTDANMADTDMTTTDETSADRSIVDTAKCSSLDTDDLHHATKRSKVDKDGFVTPATPDLSIHGNHYIDNETELKAQPQADSDLPGGMNVGRLASGLEDGEDMGQVGGETSLPPDVGQDDMDSLAASCTSLSQLLREFGQRAKMLNTDWLYTFNDSENFETFCVTRLDKMLEDVKDLEADLRQQKEGLRDKLLDLSRTLQLD